MLAQQPIVTIMSFQYTFIKERDDLDRSMFLPWVAWTGIFAALFLILMSIFGVCRFIYRYTRLSEETFGMLIAVLFLQQAVVGMISEFRRASRYARAGGIRGSMRDPDMFRREDEDLAILCNGLWALILFVGMVSTSLMVDKAREWRFGTLMLRALLADYGVPFMVVIWTALSYALQSNGNHRNVPSEIPRRVTTPLLWQVTDTWHVTKRMAELPGPLIAAALIPAVIIATLFWFDHGVSIKLGMPKVG
ncbi:hypothetical protein DUNSADRAFT_12628 [Dunaliella salina]|nr:hypothetical protein DUNSADRAFT_12628 [Dunaliella salina]|eukprot:KAF5831758.1 hypothetical protein DUNSADRAFT_12628 [Dunaliella salina]